MVGRDNEQTQLGVTQYFKLALDHYNFKVNETDRAQSICKPRYGNSN